MQLTDAEISLLARLRGEQLLQPGRPIPLLDLAVQHCGADDHARQILQRLLVHGLIKLDEAADVRHHCFGVAVTDDPVPGSSPGAA